MVTEYITKERAQDFIIAAAHGNGSRLAHMLGKLEDEPPADVVEVVRCKNCAYSDPGLYSGEVVYKCGYNSDPSLLLNGNHFCSNGRKLKGGEYND